MSCNSLVLLFNVSFTTIQSVLIPLVLSDFFFFLIWRYCLPMLDLKFNFRDIFVS